MHPATGRRTRLDVARIDGDEELGHAFAGGVAPRLAPFTTGVGSVDVSSGVDAEPGTIIDDFHESLAEPLAFVNRYAETLDVLFPNLANHESLRRRSIVKHKSPLAAQPPGSGKTALGFNLTAVLRRPREADAETETRIAERLRRARWWGRNPAPAVDAALRNTRDENLVVRTLLVTYPHHADTVLRLKHTEPLVVPMRDLVTPDFGWGFDGALAYAIFCKAGGLDGSEPASRIAFADGGRCRRGHH
jgi:hypothetical protein